MSDTKENLVILSGRAGRNFAERIVQHLKKTKKVSSDFDLGNLVIKNFSNRELNFKLETNVRKKTVYVIQSIRQGHQENIYLHEDVFEVLILNDLLTRAGADRIVNVMTHMPYLRQDRKAEGREPISAKMLFNLLNTSAGNRLNRIIVGDMHNEAEQGFADIPIDNVPSYPLFLLYYKQHPELNKGNSCVVSPDIGGVKRADYFAKALGVDLAIIDKKRKKGKEAEAMNLIGDVDNKYCIMIDDMIDTGGTLIQGARLLREHGAKEKIFTCATHGLFNKKGNNLAEERFYANNIEVLITDTIPRTQDYRDTAHKWLKTVSLAPCIADVIYCDFTGESVSAVFWDYAKQAQNGEDNINNYLLPANPKEI